MNLTASPAFAAKWLLPRLEDFHNRHPDLDVLLNTSAQSLNLPAERIGIRYGKGGWPGLTAEKWLDETLFPVCSPHFLNTHSVSSPADLLNLPLIHDISMPSESGFLGWNDWFATARSVMAEDDLRAGRLVRLFPETGCLSALTYYLVYRPNSAASKKIRAFREWMLEQAAPFQTAQMPPHAV
ncbi:LysR substrate-binding domain-containing protein [Neisseria chenwenguii]|uniref:LysR substrate-binding domain-containing protein n=1 Tax=Neisseria chenwenguii TaxID=1853278 RepID=A0A220S3F5_9NEIS|nr:LysR substrate-binding domain-containing protein [Neisseria chenwenguii]ASK28031.1 hypothetical protein BG910_10090 [Neisseria chenwenguii]ROV57182.1 hypothetical protein EGS38_00350 [Neisseria chenwenguii]